MSSVSHTWTPNNINILPPCFCPTHISRQAPTDLLWCKAFLMHVLNESQRIDGLRIITFSRGRLSCTK